VPRPEAPSATHALRLRAQLLAGPPARDVVAVVAGLLAVQAQDPRGARLAIRARSSHTSAADVDRALTEERTLVVTWLNRFTLHLVRADDYPWLRAVTTPPLARANARRLSQEGVDEDAAERGVRAIRRTLERDGPSTRDALARRVASAGVRTQGQAMVHLLALASLRGLIVRGPIVGGRHAYVLTADWLGAAGKIDRDRAMGELARRYLAGHGPASDRDLAKWSGLPLGMCRAAFASIEREVRVVDGGLVDLRRRARAGAPAPPKLLGPFEPLLLGWSSRADVVGRHQPALVAGGVFRPFALVGGRAAAPWTLKDGRAVVGEPFERIRVADRRALEADGRDVVRYLGVTSSPDR